MKKILHIIFIFSFCTLFCAEPVCVLQKRFDAARPGDFIVTRAEGHFSLMRVHTVDSARLILEEISIPEGLFKKTTWQNWIDARAPGHTSWTLYEINRRDSAIASCYSLSKKSWIYLSESEKFFSKLLSLQFLPVSKEMRKKIGPAPMHREEDHRPIWNPPIFMEGKKIANPQVEVYAGRWPKDNSQLSLCTVELYFNAKEQNFAFPYLIEIKSPHYAFKMPVVDSGRGLNSPSQLPQH